MSVRNSFRKVGLTNGYKTTNLVANPALTTSYNLTLPASTPTIAGQSLISDTNGLTTWGSTTASVSTFTGTTNPVTTPANVTGLVFTVPSTSISVYVALNAATNIYAVYSLYAYQKGSATSWGLAYLVNGDTDDDPGVVFSITSAGQVQYILGAVTGFTSLVLMWTLGTSVSNTLTSLALSSTLNVGGPSTFTAGIQGTSLALSSTFSVSGLATFTGVTGLSLLLGNANTSGTVSSTVGTLLNVQSQTYTDTGTTASGTAGGSFSASYLGVPTLAATNTAVTTPVASTLTIAGAPVAGTNETITNAYALNVLSGNARFGGNVTVNVLTYPANHVFLAAGNQVSVAAGQHYPYRFNSTAILLEGASWYLSSMMSSNGSVFTPGFAGVFTIVWNNYQPGSGFECVIAKNATLGPAFDNSNNGSTLALFSNGVNATATLTDFCATAKFTSLNATDFIYFGYYNMSGVAVTPSNARNGIHIYLDHYI